MTFDDSLKMGLLDISIMHILRKKKQSPMRTAKKIVNTFHNTFPNMVMPAENDADFARLVSLVEALDFLGIRLFFLNRL